jgi:hypothetical protein
VLPSLDFFVAACYGADARVIRQQRWICRLRKSSGTDVALISSAVTQEGGRQPSLKARLLVLK